MFKKIFSKKILIIIVIIILFFSFNFLSFSNPLKRSSQNLFIWVADKIKPERTINQLSECSDLYSQIDFWRNQAEDSTFNQAKFQSLKEENDVLRDYFNFFKEEEFTTVLSNVIAQETVLGLRGQEQQLLIDKGSFENLEPNLAVVNQKGSVVGKIASVKEKTALVCLITSSNCSLSASILNSQSNIGLTKGELGLTVSLDMIPQTEEIVMGDIVVTAGLSDKIPGGLVIGRVSKIEKRGNEIWQRALIEPAASLNNLNILAIVIP
jgi:rod shape-determining protein MreC